MAQVDGSKWRSSNGANPTTAGVLAAVFQIAWVHYGLILSRAVIVWNVIAVLIDSSTVGAYFRFDRIETSRRSPPA